MKANITLITLQKWLKILKCYTARGIIILCIEICFVASPLNLTKAYGNKSATKGVLFVKCFKSNVIKLISIR